jgi:hypothetical protein
MKAPKLTDLAKPKQSNTTAKNDASKPTKVDAVRKTFSFSQSHVNHINTMAVNLSKKEGRPVNASEALRAIIDQHKAVQ